MHIIYYVAQGNENNKYFIYKLIYTLHNTYSTCELLVYTLNHALFIVGGTFGSASIVVFTVAAASSG